MHPVLLLLLLLLPLTSSSSLHAAASNDVGNGTTCAPARCGDVNITYPFSLRGVQPLHCGYPAFALTCDAAAGRAYLSRTFKEHLYLVRNISYDDGSLVVSVEANFAGNGSCPFPDFNASSGLGLFPLNVSAANDNLVIVHNCSTLLPRQLNPHNLSCGPQRMEAFITQQRSGESSVADDVPKNCSFITVPVRGGGEARNYKNLITSGFLVEWETVGDCSACSRSGGECRFEEGSFHCVCLDASLPCSSRGRGNRGIKIGAGIGAAVVCLTILGIACTIHNIRRKRKRSASLDGLIRQGTPLASLRKEFSLAGSPGTHIFTYEELDEATDGFSDARELGAGGFGTVYKGILRDGSVVAVKRLYKNKGVEQFQNEVAILSRLRHPNLVTLYGCTTSSTTCCRDLLLAYEFVPNGTLADHLHGARAHPLLEWRTRLAVAVETASALEYLHAVEPHQVVHRDVKTSNILLDDGFHVKVADFGLSRLFPPDATHVSTAPQGTPGYVDPAYHLWYQLTDKSDVYSFGVVLVELISSRPAVDMSRAGAADVNLASMAVRMIQRSEVDQLVDPRLGYGSASETKTTVDLVAEVAFRCLQPEQDVRPPISEVLDVLREAQRMEKGGCAGGDAGLLKKSRDGSPDTVMHQWISPSTTSNHSS